MRIKCERNVLWLLVLGALVAYAEGHARLRWRSPFVLPAPERSASCLPGWRCSPPVQCPARVAPPPAIKTSAPTCELLSGAIGVCCHTGFNHSEGLRRRTLAPLLAGLAHLAADAENMVHGLLSKHGPMPLAGSPADVRHLNDRLGGLLPFRGDPDIPQAVQGVLVTKKIMDQMAIPVEEMLLSQPFSPGSLCPPRPDDRQACHRRDLFRSLDGSCNNVFHSRWGAARSPMTKLLPPAYEDGVWLPRLRSSHGEPLPSSRLVSSTIFGDFDRPSRHASAMLMQFGQLIAHDLTFSPSTKHENGSGVSCCLPDGSAPLPPSQMHFACLPIEVPPQDPFYSHFGVRCMEFVRAALGKRQDCAIGYALQADMASHFLDASPVYGVDTQALNSELRTLQGGRLRVNKDFGRPLLPLAGPRGGCRLADEASACFIAGDSRINQNTGLVVLQTLFLRHHNKLAAELQNQNPHWDDNRLFQEARRLLIAQLQHIVYEEWLPIVLGKETMLDFGLIASSFHGENDHSHAYDHMVDPSISSEFAAAAFRFGHSTVDGRLRLYKVDGSMDQVLSLPDLYFDPSRMRIRPFYDLILGMLTTKPMQAVDNSFSEALSVYLFRGGNPFGLDLVATNIQRGRDHGLQPYNAYRELTGLARANDFDNFKDIIPPVVVEAMKHVYHSPEDVDLFVGGLLERPLPGGLLGPTFAAIVADQFQRLRLGDRYFYDLFDLPHSFTEEQLQEIQKTTMARLVCDNRDGIELVAVPLNAFLLPGHAGNPTVLCDDPKIPDLDYTVWKEVDF